jgi:hypothetical protein
VIWMLTQHAGVLRDWKHIGLYLGLSDADLLDIECRGPRLSLKDNVRETLLLWRERYGQDATLQSLVNTLKDLKHTLASGK